MSCHVRDKPETFDEFKVSGSWFEKNLETIADFRVLVTYEEAFSSEYETDKQYVVEFINYVDSEAFVTHDIYNYEKTVLSGKEMPREDVSAKKG